MRLNFSKSGVGASAGVKGFRVSTGPRGTYVNIGGGGVYYRERIAGPYGQQTVPSQSSPVPPTVAGFAHPIPTADVERLVDSNSAATLQILNQKLRAPGYATTICVTGVVIALIAASIHVVLTGVLLAFAAYLTWLASQFDQARRCYQLHFNFDDYARQKWLSLNAALASLARSQAVWRIEGTANTWDWKRNAGVSRLCQRMRSSLSQAPPPYLNCNITPYRLDSGVQKLYFMPDRLYVLQGSQYGAVEYESLTALGGTTDFVEDEFVPTDSLLVGRTWQFVNKNGTPDRRFNYNRELPVLRYGVFTLRSTSGLNLVFHVSSTVVAQSFCQMFQVAIAKYFRKAQQQYSGPAGTQQRSSNQQKASSHQRQYTSGGTGPSNTQQSQRQQDTPRSPTSSTIPKCYSVLGLSLNCTRVEAEAKYKQLVREYHPDQVAHLASELRNLAESRMKEINVAYGELKKLRDW